MPTVLIADDTDVVRNVVQECVRISCPSFQILIVEDGAMAWEIISKAKELPELVISDVEMPRMNGDELASKIKENHPEIRIILMSGKGAPQGHKADVFLKKPLDVAEFLAIIQKQLAQVA